MKKKLFEYAVVYHEYTTTEKGKEYVGSTLIQSPKFMLASSDKEVAFKATREIPEKYAENPDNVEILIRNF